MPLNMQNFQFFDLCQEGNCEHNSKKKYEFTITLLNFISGPKSNSVSSVINIWSGVKICFLFNHDPPRWKLHL